METKKEILKKYTGKGGPGLKDVVKEIPGTISGMGSNLKKALNPGGISIVGGIKRGVEKFKNFKAEDDALNAAAGKAQGNVSSNERNVGEFLKIKSRLKKERATPASPAVKEPINNMIEPQKIMPKTMPLPRPLPSRALQLKDSMPAKMPTTIPAKMPADSPKRYMLKRMTKRMA